MKGCSQHYRYVVFVLCMIACIGSASRTNAQFPENIEMRYASAKIVLTNFRLVGVEAGTNDSNLYNQPASLPTADPDRLYALDSKFAFLFHYNCELDSSASAKPIKHISLTIRPSSGYLASYSTARIASGSGVGSIVLTFSPPAASARALDFFLELYGQFEDGTNIGQVVINQPLKFDLHFEAPKRFAPDFGARATWNTQVAIPAELGRLDPMTSGIDSNAVQIDLISVAGPVRMLASNRLGIAGNPGKNFKLNLTVRYKTPVSTKLFANLKLDTILPNEVTQLLMQHHIETWHFDTESRPGYTSVQGEGELTFQLIGAIPDKSGSFDFDIDVGLMPGSGGLLKKLYGATLLTEFKTPEELRFTSVAYSPDGKSIAVGDAEGSVHILSSDDGRTIDMWRVAPAPIFSLAYSPNGQLLAAGVDRSIENNNSLAEILLCDTSDGKVAGSLDGHEQRVNSLCFTVEDSRLASAGNDGRVAIWDIRNGKLIREFKEPGTWTTGMSYDQESHSLAVVVSNRIVAASVSTETMTKTLTVQMCRQETRTQDYQVTIPQISQETISRLVDVEGDLVKKDFAKTVCKYHTETRQRSFTVAVPYSETVQVPYTVLKANPTHIQVLQSAVRPRVVRLSAGDARVLGSWRAEGERLPVGTGWAADGKRLFVTTRDGVSVLEPMTMLELVELRSQTKKFHTLSPAFSASLDQLVVPAVSTSLGSLAALDFLRPRSSVGDSFFDSLAESAKLHKQKSVELASKARQRYEQTQSPNPSDHTLQPSAESSGVVKNSDSLSEPVKPLEKLAEIEASVQSIALTQIVLDAVEVGGVDASESGRTRSDFQLEGETFSEGLFAQSNSRFALQLTSGWATFSTLFGVEDGHTGSVSFVILGDGKPLYRSSIIRDHILHGITIDVRGVKLLELITEKADKETTEDWGVWLEPTLSRKPSSEAYPHKFQELKIVAKQVDGCDLRISAAGIEVLGLKKSDPHLTVNGMAWQPKANRALLNQGETRFLFEDLDFARARVHVHHVPNGGSLAYAYATDHVRLELAGFGNIEHDHELILQIPTRKKEWEGVDTLPVWEAPWKVAGWEYPASWWGELPTEVPPKEKKPFGVGEFQYVDWDWWDTAFPFTATPPDRFVLIGERKFTSDGGVYRIETLSNEGIRIKLDGEVIIDNWALQEVTQNARMLEVSAGSHTLRFENFDAVQRSRVGIELRCVEPKGGELQRKSIELTEEQLIAKNAVRKSIDRLRELGAYVDEEINSPVPLVAEVNFQVAQQKVENSVMSALLSLPGIKTLEFGANELVPKAWSQLSLLTDLRKLILSYGAVDEEDLKQIAKLNSLESLVILGNDINDEKLTVIASMNKLKALECWHMPLTDSSIDTLVSMPALRHLNFGGTQFTEAGGEKLMRARPDIKAYLGMKIRMIWIPSNENVKSIFVHQADGHWHEHALVGEGYHFEETSRTEEFVELFDPGRAMRIRLFDDRAEMRIGDAQFSRWKAGSWGDTSRLPEGFGLSKPAGK